MDDFWRAIDAQLAELTTAGSADDVINILNRYCPPSSGEAFFAGSGGDETVYDALHKAGWTILWFEAPYYWCMEAPDGSKISYVEGDVYRGNRRGHVMTSRIPLRKSYEVVGWSYNAALYCVDHVPGLPTEAVTVISATGVSQGVLDGNGITVIDAPSPVFLDQITEHDVCDLCFIPLDA